MVMEQISWMKNSKRDNRKQKGVQDEIESQCPDTSQSICGTKVKFTYDDICEHFFRISPDQLFSTE